MQSLSFPFKSLFELIYNSILILINYSINFLGSYEFLLFAEITAVITKLFVLGKIIKHATKSNKFQRLWILLILVVVSALAEDLTWIIKILRSYIPEIDYRILLFCIRASWALAIVQYQSLALFIESLIAKHMKLSWRNIMFLIVSTAYFLGFLYLLIFENKIAGPRPDFEFILLNHVSRYLLIIMLPTIFITMRNLLKIKGPTILRKQLKILTVGLMVPRIVSDFIQLYPFNLVPDYVASNIFVVAISTLLIAYAAYYCTNKVLKLRFLNMQNHVEPINTKFDFINDFKDILEQLSYATTTGELKSIVRNFFNKAFQIPNGRTNLHFRNLGWRDKFKKDKNIIKIPSSEQSVLNKSIVENFINSGSEVQKYIQQKQILIFDELEFSNFYDDNLIRTNILNFLNQINAEIFIPIYQDSLICAYIIIEKDLKRKELYSHIDRDEMLVFGSYLGHIINLLQKQNLDTLILKEKELKEELFLKHQEINQYKESIRSVLKPSTQKQIGILFYKNNKFTFANQYAKEIIKINLNYQDGHPIAKKLKSLAKQVIEYKSAQTSFIKDINNQKLILSAVPNLEHNNVIITVSYPDISDIVKQQIDKLHDPSRWDYLLYLETTKSGQLINKLIPGSGENLLNFKINLLKIALSKKAILLSLPSDDLINTAEIINHISLRDNLHIIDLQAKSLNFDVAIKLFGINPIFGQQANSKPILQTLNNGTLFIRNIHLLDIETQNYLAEFIKYGFYHVFKSDHKETSNARIVCSSNQNLRNLVKEEKFSRALYNELKETKLEMPSLLTLPTNELDDLVQALSEQVLENSEFKNLLNLSDSDRKKLISKQMVSISEFKIKIKRLISEKSKTNNLKLETKTTIDQIYNTSDPKLIAAARLGKHALKDPHIMHDLWNKFKNQNKIATFLGVNRSSVHRRCKEYNLL